MYLFLDESQDATHFVLAGVAAPDLITLQGAVGDMRTAARRARLAVPEFYELRSTAIIPDS